MMRYYLPIAFGRIGVSYNDMERTVTNRRGVRNGTAFRLCTDYVLLRNLGILGRWKDTVWKEGKMSAYAHQNGGKFKDEFCERISQNRK